MRLILAVLLLACAPASRAADAWGGSWGTSWGSSWGASTAALVEVPDCTTSPTAQASCVSAVEGAGFVSSVVSLCHDTVASGNVISTTPPAAAEAEEGSTVVIRVANGEACETPKGRRLGLGIGISLN